MFANGDGGAANGVTCFPTTVEDIATPSGAESYFARLGLAFCGP